jgi:hypothetical protein
MRYAAAALAFALSGVAWAQNDLSGFDQFPQFRSLSGLPGGGFGVLRNGDPSFRGAMGFSTPIAHSLGRGRFAFVGANTSFNRRLGFDRTTREDSANSTAAGMFGLSTPWGNLTTSGMILSGIGDNVLNLHFSPRLQREDEYSLQEGPRIALGVGVQDVFSTGGSSGQNIDLTIGGRTSRSFYAVATAELTPDLYVSVGTGTRRFRGVFANASYNVTPWLKGVAEYDAFNWNYGVAGDLFRVPIGSDRAVQATAFLGFVRGKHLTWSLGFSF